MLDSSQMQAVLMKHGRTAMIEHKQQKATVYRSLTQELELAFMTFTAKLSWMLQQGWKGQWVAISGAEILSHSDSKRALREKYCALHREKKLLLRKVFPPATNQEFEIW